MSNRKLFIVFVAFASLIIQHSIVVAQSNESLLWKISRKDLPASSYLFGTIHIICEKDYVQPPFLKECFDRTEQLYLELDMDDPTIMTEMQQQMNMKNGETLTSIMKPEDYQLVAKFFKDSLGIGLDFFKSTKPVLLSSMVMIKMLDGCKTESYEMNFVQLAKEVQKEVFGLETVEEQMAVLDAMPSKQQAEELFKTVNKYNAYKSYLKQMIMAYKSQNVAKIYELTTSSEFAVSTDDNELLINSRNKNWIPKIDKIAHEKPTFFAVGIGHLGGPNGVIELLKKNGFTVEPVN